MGERFVILLGCGGRSVCKINAKGWMTSMTHLNKVERLGDYDIGPTTEPEPHVGILDGVSDDESPARVISHDMAKTPEYLFNVLENNQGCTAPIHVNHVRRESPHQSHFVLSLPGPL